MTIDDDARHRALEENARRSRVMAEAQHFGPPIPMPPCSRTSHIWSQGQDYLMCEVCAATIPPPEAEPGVQVVPLE